MLYAMPWCVSRRVCCTHNFHPHHNKYTNWSIKCPFRGYSSSQNGYKCYDPVKLYVCLWMFISLKILVTFLHLKQYISSLFSHFYCWCLTQERMDTISWILWLIRPLYYLDQFNWSKGFLMHLNQGPIKNKNPNLKLDGQTMGFKLGNKYLELKGDPN